MWLLYLHNVYYQEIDENSLCYGFKYLKNKPVRDLKGDQFLRIMQAEQDGLLVTAIRIDLDTSGGGRSFSTYFDEIKQYFYRVSINRSEKSP